MSLAQTAPFVHHYGILRSDRGSKDYAYTPRTYAHIRYVIKSVCERHTNTVFHNSPAESSARQSMLRDKRVIIDRLYNRDPWSIAPSESAWNCLTRSREESSVNGRAGFLVIKPKENLSKREIIRKIRRDSRYSHGLDCGFHCVDFLINFSAKYKSQSSRLISNLWIIESTKFEISKEPRNFCLIIYNRDEISSINYTVIVCQKITYKCKCKLVNEYSNM